MAKNIRICRYACCPIENKEINISNEPYEIYNRRYFHKACLEKFLIDEETKKKNQEEKREERRLEREKRKQEEEAAMAEKRNQRADTDCIFDLWCKRISNTVNYAALRQVLNEYFERGISGDYMIFALQYVLDHKIPLRYPAGFRYILDKQEIKDAYQKQQAVKILKQQKEVKPRVTNAPQFALNREKSGGFGNIFNK